MVLIHHCTQVVSIYPGSIAFKVYTWGPAKCGPYEQVHGLYIGMVVLNIEHTGLVLPGSGLRSDMISIGSIWRHKFAV